MGTPAERALEYTRKKIDQNFSNYSAWHSRTVLLPIAHSVPSAEERAEGAEGSSSSSRSSDAQAAADTALSQGSIASGGGERQAEERGPAVDEARGQEQAAGGAAGSGSNSNDSGRYAGECQRACAALLATYCCLPRACHWLQQSLSVSYRTWCAGSRSISLGRRRSYFKALATSRHLASLSSFRTA